MGTLTLNQVSSATLGSANTDYLVVAANPVRRLLIIQNTHQTATLWVNFGAAAYANSVFTGVCLSPGTNLQLDAAVPANDIHLAATVGAASYTLLEG